MGEEILFSRKDRDSSGDPWSEKLRCSFESSSTRSRTIMESPNLSYRKPRDRQHVACIIIYTVIRERGSSEIESFSQSSPHGECYSVRKFDLFLSLFTRYLIFKHLIFTQGIGKMWYLVLHMTHTCMTERIVGALVIFEWSGIDK